MSGGGSTEESGEADGFAHKRVLHEINIPDETGKERAEREEYSSGVGAERADDLAVHLVRHGAGHERRPQTHQHAGDNADDDAFSGDRASHAGETAVGLAVKRHGDERADHTSSE